MKSISKISSIILIVVSLLLVISCETVVTYELPINETKLVIEGAIENDGVPLVIVSKSFPFFGNVNFNDLSELLIPEAKVTVSNVSREVELMEYDPQVLGALSDTDFALIEPILEQIVGFDIDQSLVGFLPDITFYTVSPADLDFIGVIGTDYDLKVELFDHEIFGDIVVNGSTFIPFPVTLDSLWVEAHPNEDVDTNLVQLRARFDDPDTVGNFYRIFNRANGGPFLTASNSVFDDAFIEGASIPISITRGQTEAERQEETDFDIVGYWAPGEIAEVKFCVIDEPHYEFWRTVENEKNNLGSPFGSYTILSSNLDNGAVGNWGGYASTTMSILITEVNE